jgi:hypothetical protein
MKPRWSWRWAWLPLLCLLLSLGLQVSIHHHKNNFEWNHAVASRESRTLSWGEILQPASRVSMQGRAGPRESLSVPDVFFYAENLHPVGPPWFEYRGPPDRYRASGRTARLPVTLAAPNGAVNYACTLHFRPVDRPN